jgi:O-antigen ligase
MIRRPGSAGNEPQTMALPAARAPVRRITTSLPLTFDPYGRVLLRRRFAGFGLALLILLSIVGTSPMREQVLTLGSDASDSTRQFLVIVIVLLLFLGTITGSNLRQMVALPTTMIILLCYCLLTVTWAIAPDIAFRRLVLTAAAVWAACRATTELGPARTLKIAWWVLAAVIVADYLAVGFSSFGVQHYVVGSVDPVGGNWRGIHEHKNIAGNVCGIGLVLFFFEKDAVHPWIRNVLIAATLYFLLMTGSRTSFGAAGFALVSAFLLRKYDPRHRSLWILTIPIVAVLGLQLYSIFVGQVLEGMANPTALTGRTQIWPYLLRYASENLWTGAGFGSFWQIGAVSPIWTMTNSWVARLAGHGHNGYLDLLVTIGLPGLILAMLTLFVWPVLQLQLSYGVASRHRLLLIAIFAYVAASNMTETSLLDRLSTDQLFLSIALVMTKIEAAQSQGRQHQLRARALRILRLSAISHPKSAAGAAVADARWRRKA